MNAREGFTLMEVLIAIVLLGFAVLGVQAAITDRFIRDVGHEDHRATALQLAADRITTILNEPRYNELNARFGGTEASVAGFPRYSRQTRLSTAPGYTVVTVRVVTPTATDTVSLTSVVGAP